MKSTFYRRHMLMMLLPFKSWGSGKLGVVQALVQGRTEPSINAAFVVNTAVSVA